MEQVYNRYYDTAGNYHWTGVYSGEHIERGERMNDSTVEHKCEYCTANTIPKDKYPCVYCSLNEEHEPIKDRFRLCVWLYKSRKRKEAGE